MTDVEGLLDKCADSLRVLVEANFIAARQVEIAGPRAHPASVVKDVIPQFEAEWIKPGRKWERVPAKDLLSMMNNRLREAGAKGTSARALSYAIRRSELDVEVIDFLTALEGMIGSRP